MSKVSKSIVGLATGLFFVLQGSLAFADLLPNPGHRHGAKRLKCTEIQAGSDENAPDQAKLVDFLTNNTYKSVSAPEITKLDGGKFRVCAVFSR